MEAQYHPICRNNFNNDYQNHERGRKRGKKAADNIDSLQARKMAAHDKSYCVVKDYILRNVVEHKEVVQLRSMCNLYRKTMEGEGFPNPEYRSEKLSPCKRLAKDISRELTFSKLTTILSRLGHSETYDFSMELETAMAKAFDEMSTNLTPQIITGEGNTVFHSEWDNLNRITTNVHGSNVVNSAGGNHDSRSEGEPLWKYEEEFSKHVNLIGKFHTAMNYMSRLTGRKCLGAGYAEILIEAGLANSGCLKNILSGKSYAKALFSLKAVTEALERLLFNVFLEEEKPDIPYEILFNLIHSCTSESLNSTLKDPTLLKLIGDYLQYQDKVRRGHLGKTGMFWLSMMDHARLVFMMDFAVKTNNFELFHHCNGAMADLFFAYDGHNYARYLTWFEAFLTNIDLSHPGALDYIKLGAIAVARSLIPGALAAVDKTMEETFMRFAKTSGGLLGLFNNCGAYQKWCRTTSARAQIYELTLEMCGMIDDPEMPKAGKHRELEPAQIKKSELAVQSVISAINGFTNPWKIPDKSRLYSLASGAPIDPEKFTLKTMDYCSKRVKLTSAQGKLFVYKEQSNLTFQLLVKSQIMEITINLEELMRYPLSPRAESEEHAALDKVTDYANNNLSEDEELEMEEIELEDLFSDDEDDE
ncbi:hypothetical protein KUCAC02_003199 [Chaenocephalus aceratus]|uniref:Uncharacterized protein n=1 Tax=Chaenocephalus aceratus TaxID=36190 RepID=A0ACB9WK93_CHAAC|nr:hypothetical protein KUCAC02_003199 [Chaenocephalus aceratus]